MLDLCDLARTILLVTHALQKVKGHVLHKGQRIQPGKPDEIREAYTNFLQIVVDAITLEEV